MQSNQKQAGSAKYRYKSKVGLGTSSKLHFTSKTSTYPIIYCLNQLFSVESDHTFLISHNDKNKKKKNMLQQIDNLQVFYNCLILSWYQTSKGIITWYPALIQRDINTYTLYPDLTANIRLVSDRYYYTVDNWHGKPKQKNHFKWQLHHRMLFSPHYQKKISKKKKTNLTKKRKLLFSQK